MKSLAFCAATAVLFLAAAPASAGCGPDAEPCAIDAGTYHALLPTGQEAGSPPPAVVFLHGYGGSGAATLAVKGMVARFRDAGFAVIAPDGQLREGRNGRSWALHGGWRSRRDDAAFVIAVADDAAARFGLDRRHMVLAGFSLGGSMASYIACSDPEAFAAYAPIAGSFWRPMPESCAGPVRLFHTHGTADGTVPFAGRVIRPGLEQGDVGQSLETLAAASGCAPVGEEQPLPNGLTERDWSGCRPDASLTLVLHPSGHRIPDFWAGMVLDWLTRES